MKGIITYIFIILFALPVASQNTLTVHQKDGQKFSFGFEEKPIASFTDNYLVIKSTKVEVQYELAKITKFTFLEVILYSSQRNTIMKLYQDMTNMLKKETSPL